MLGRGLRPPLLVVSDRAPGLPAEQSCLSLVWAVLDRASAGWRGVEMTPAVVRRLQNLRRELIEPHGEHDDKEVIDESVTARRIG